MKNAKIKRQTFLVTQLTMYTSEHRSRKISFVVCVSILSIFALSVSEFGMRIKCIR